MEDLKKVEKVLFAEEVDMGEMKVRQPFPTRNVDRLDPFLLLHHHRSEILEGTHPRDAGVGPHPHRGFTPVTFVIEGAVHHRDSRGNSDVVEAPGVQWMDAGMGIVHSERPGKAFAREGGALEIVQLWINLPRSFKMMEPCYQAFQDKNVPRISSEDKKAVLRVYAGQLSGHKGPLKSKVEVTAARLDLGEGGSFRFSAPAQNAVYLYLLCGTLRIRGFGLLEQYYLALFGEKGENIVLEATSDARMLILSGKPLDEPVVTYGPFVMNDQTQVLEAMRDYQMGKMGILIEEF